MQFLWLPGQLGSKSNSWCEKTLGYQPLRYNGMAQESVPDGKQPREVLTRAVKSTAAVITDPTIGEP